MLVKMNQKIAATLAVITLAAGVGLSVAPLLSVNANDVPTQKAVKQLPAAYRRTWYAYGTVQQEGITLNVKLRLKITKGTYKILAATSYKDEIVSNVSVSYKKYTVRKTKNGTYKLVLFKKVNGAWVADSTDTLKVTTKKFNGKRFKVLKEGSGSSALYLFKSASQAKKANYNVMG